MSCLHAARSLLSIPKCLAFSRRRGSHGQQLLAFRVATPIAYISDEPIDFSYGPQSQTAVWSGSGKALAVLHCTTVTSGKASCNAWGGSGHKRCDS